MKHANGCLAKSWLVGWLVGWLVLVGKKELLKMWFVDMRFPLMLLEFFVRMKSRPFDRIFHGGNQASFIKCHTPLCEEIFLQLFLITNLYRFVGTRLKPAASP